MKIAVGSDHAGYSLKQHLLPYLREKGYQVDDLGSYDEASTDYPTYGEKVGRAVVSGEYDMGLVICGTGQGIGIAANKVAGVRCAVCTETCSATLARLHNDANVLSLGARVVGPSLAEAIVDAFFGTEHKGGERHERRIGMINAIKP